MNGQLKQRREVAKGKIRVASSLDVFGLGWMVYPTRSRLLPVRRVLATDTDERAEEALIMIEVFVCTDLKVPARSSEEELGKECGVAWATDYTLEGGEDKCEGST
ncbi:hypothetical protein DUI87_22896 [Hirundo rustica rustica]|uniref:Uncharacterized protein n=1 Tax=Hirundo rustica rustica TaxID=333673 RepID=A0A3M0JHF9_HIRRU|nr:hypothetical protein DUI87_22896 [Hirundo rustica rustica]